MAVAAKIRSPRTVLPLPTVRAFPGGTHAVARGGCMKGASSDGLEAPPESPRMLICRNFYMEVYYLLMPN